MGKTGRYGKYGEVKRLERLREGPLRPECQAPAQTGRSYRAGKVYSKIFTRDLLKSDEEFVRRLSRQAFEKYGPYENILAEWIDSGFTVTFLAGTKKASLGFGMLSFPFNNSMGPGLATELLAIAVIREKRERGIGRFLLGEAEKRAVKLGGEAIFLHTAIDNIRARKLFHRQGFVSLEVEEKYYPNGQDAVLMRKDMRIHSWQ